MSGYTPGPWIAGDDEGSDYYLVGPHDGDGIVYQPVVKLHSEANARLIAAAPELLEALIEARSVCMSVSISLDRRIKRDGSVLYAQTEEWCRWVEDEVGPKIAAAIAKTTGGTA